MMQSNMANKYSNITASAAVKVGGGVLKGMYVNSTSTGTIRFNDGSDGTPSAGAKATGVITSSGVFADGETITVGVRTYTLKTTLDNSVAYQVLLGANAAAALDNLKSAINGTAGAGTTYSLGTDAHPQVTATTNTDTAQTVEAISIGTASNAIATTDTCTNAAWGGAVLSGGTNPNTTINNTITPAIGYHSLGDANFSQGLYATIANTLNVTLYYE